MKAAVFNAYSHYYDLLYRDKDYHAETTYIHSLIQVFFKEAKSILELGSGTGMHACLLAQLGYDVTGIDQSKTMLQKATERKSHMPVAVADKITFYEGDIRSYQSDKMFDVAISLFHVMSYMETDSDLEAAFQTAKKQIKPGGLFIFDCWYGPGVLYDKPVSRIKKFEDDAVAVSRKSTPESFPDKHLVRVHFEINILNKKTQEETSLLETHQMRYLFTEELIALANKNGMRIIHTEEWMNKKVLSETSWNACYICQINS